MTPSPLSEQIHRSLIALRVAAGIGQRWRNSAAVGETGQSQCQAAPEPEAARRADGLSWPLQLLKPDRIAADAELPGILAPLALQPTPLSEADHVVFQACCQQGLGQPVRGALIRRHCQQVHIRADIPVAT